MLDDATTAGAVPEPRCNWCSAPLPSDHEVTCPSCGATLLGDGDTAVPGLTAIDAEAILRNARAAKTKPRGRLLSWISGDYDDGGSGPAAAPGSLAPPPAEVRREMLRLELEAQLTNAQAEVESLAADAAVEEGRSLEPLAELAADDDPAALAAAFDPEIADPDAVRVDGGVAHEDHRRDEAPPA
jgi:hypothetical protein